MARCVTSVGLEPARVAYTETYRDTRGWSRKKAVVHIVHIFAMDHLRAVARFDLAFDGIDAVSMRIVDGAGSPVYPLPGAGTNGTGYVLGRFGDEDPFRDVLTAWRITCNLTGRPRPEEMLDGAGIQSLPEPMLPGPAQGRTTDGVSRDAQRDGRARPHGRGRDRPQRPA